VRAPVGTVLVRTARTRVGPQLVMAVAQVGTPRELVMGRRLMPRVCTRLGTVLAGLRVVTGPAVSVGGRVTPAAGAGTELGL
jgi:hypothetical protein